MSRSLATLIVEDCEDDAELMVRTERAMTAYRGLLQAGAPVEQVENQARTVGALLTEAREKLDGAQLSRATTFVSALVILLREGAEAILVVAAIISDPEAAATTAEELAPLVNLSPAAFETLACGAV